MKKIKIYILYVLQLFIIGMFILVLIGDKIQFRNKNFYENEMFTENVRGLQMSSGELYEMVEFSIPKINGKEYMMYRYISSSERATVRGIYGTSDVFDFSSIIGEGRFFTADDYINGTMTAVIGSELLPLTIEHDGKRFYLFDNAEYEVIGIFSQQSNIADKTAFLNLTAVDANIGQVNGVYFIDAKDASTVNTVVSQLKKDIAGRFTVMDIEYEVKNSVEIGRYFTTLFTFCIISAILCLIITTIFLITGQQYSIAVKKLCGMTKADLFKYYGKVMAVITSIAFVMIVISMKLLPIYAPISIFRFCVIDTLHYVLMGIVLFAIGSCNTYFIVRLSNAVNISSVLKGI